MQLAFALEPRSRPSPTTSVASSPEVPCPSSGLSALCGQTTPRPCDAWLDPNFGFSFAKHVIERRCRLWQERLRGCPQEPSIEEALFGAHPVLMGLAPTRVPDGLAHARRCFWRRLGEWPVLLEELAAAARPLPKAARQAYQQVLGHCLQWPSVTHWRRLFFDRPMALAHPARVAYARLAPSVSLAHYAESVSFVDAPPSAWLLIRCLQATEDLFGDHKLFQWHALAWADSWRQVLSHPETDALEHLLHRLSNAYAAFAPKPLESTAMYHGQDHFVFDAP